MSRVAPVGAGSGAAMAKSSFTLSPATVAFPERVDVPIVAVTVQFPESTGTGIAYPPDAEETA